MAPAAHPTQLGGVAGVESKRAIIAAIAANLAIAVMKFVAAAVTGSSVMIAEGIHSLVDTGDGVLIWIGVKRSQRGPDERHPLGHGQELYFWVIVVAVLVFAVGGGMSLYEGIMHALHPEPIRDVAWSYAVLGGAVVFEGASWGFAWHGFRKEQRGRSIWETINTTKDPSTFAILFEDTAAVVGLLIALGGVSASLWLGSPLPDAIASMLIGLLLMTAALFLARTARRLVIGESADPALVAAIRRLLEGDATVDRVDRLLTVHFGPDTVLVSVEVRFRAQTAADELLAAIDRLSEGIRELHPSVKHVAIEAQRRAPAAAAVPVPAA
jgi:cation diffusion facilitator family transporter